MAEPLPTIVTDDVNALIRHGLTTLAGVLLYHGVLAQGQQAEFVQVGLSVVTFAITIGWSWWQKHRAKQGLLVALTLPTGATEQTVSDVMKTSSASIPSVLTPQTVAPELLL